MDLGGLMRGLAQMLTWPAPLRLRPLAEADVDPLASLIVTILGEFEFEWLATEEQREVTREGKAANLRHSLGLCAADPDHNAFWVLEDSSSGRMAGSVGIRRAARGDEARDAPRAASKPPRARLLALGVSLVVRRRVARRVGVGAFRRPHLERAVVVALVLAQAGGARV